MSRQHRMLILSVGLALSVLLVVASGCGSSGAGGSSGTAASGAQTTAQIADDDTAGWRSHASEICRHALPDGTHELVGHFDKDSIKKHGMAVIAAGSQLDELGPPPNADPAEYDRMLDAYKRSANYHALALRALDTGDDGNAVGLYATGLHVADQADAMAMRLGAADCGRFGLES